MTRLDAALDDTAKILSDSRRLLDEGRRMLDDLTNLRRDLYEARLESGRNPILESEIAVLRVERNWLRERLETSERENDYLLRDLVSCHRRLSSSSLRSPSLNRRRRSDRGLRSGGGW